QGGSMPKLHLLPLFAFVVAVPAIALAQKPVTKTTTMRATSTIQAIDSTRRMVTLRNEAGEEDTFLVGADVKRFDELKVGDRIHMTYVESIVVTIHKPGAPAGPSTASASAVPTTGRMPGATLSTQQTTTVTVKAINAAVPSITVLTADGRTVTRKIEDKKN